jgi:hypothetical protein
MSVAGHGDVEQPFDPPQILPPPPHPGSERPNALPEGRPHSDVDLDLGVIVVPHRDGGSSAKWLPPLFLVMLGAAFLAYRASASDWRGFSFEQIASLWSSQPAAKVEAPKPPAATAPELALNNESSPPVPETKSAPKPHAVAKTGADTPKEADPKASVDPLEDIRREAEKTKEQIAKLEKLKEEESKKLADTADERRLADRNGRRGMAIKQLEEQQRRFEQQIAQLEAMHRRQFAQMFQRQRDAMRQFGMGGRSDVPGPGRMVRPGAGRGLVAPPPDLFMGLPRNGDAEVREFFGPGGVHGFEMRWQGRFRNGFPMEPKPEEVPAPPPAPGVPEGN